mmetsp:Transcript_17978/g.30182  ORF Transcript_17978/g.30182 Transcript_17978/m.30182 type:complete len:130 (+) Transcript_17978:105-494(+)
MQRWVSKQSDQFHFIHRPGEVMRHRGAHFHMVFNLVQPELNRVGFSMSIGYKVESATLATSYINAAHDVGYQENGGTVKPVRRVDRQKIKSRKGFVSHLKGLPEKAPKLKRSRGGFQPGNQEYKKRLKT